MGTEEPVFFHAIDPTDELTCHNLYVDTGRVVSVSYARGSLPEGSGIVSPYEAFARERPKEEAFEQIRAAEFPHQPSRLGAIFAFHKQELAERPNREWWKGQRVILTATLRAPFRVGIFDSHQLDAGEPAWPDAARRYWSELFTERPFPEVVIYGVIQLHGWELYGRALS